MKRRVPFAFVISLLTVSSVLPSFAAWPSARGADSTTGGKLGAAVALIDVDRKRAAGQLESLLKRGSLLDDYVLFYLSRATRHDDPAGARTKLISLLLQYPDSAVAADAAAELAELLLESGELDTLLALADERTAEARESMQASRIALAAGRALMGTDPPKAAAYLIKARELAPPSAGTTPAVEALRRLRDANDELRPRTANAIYAEALLTGKEGNLDAHAELLDRFLRTYPNDRRALDATLARARAMSRLESRAQAARWLDKKAAKAKDKRSKARLLFAAAGNYWNAHENTKALGKFEAVLALGTGGSEEQRSHYAMGRIHEAARRYTAAASAYRKAAKGSDSELAKESEWRAGWASYRARNYEGAAHVFGRMAESRKSSVRTRASGREEALYWQARCLELAGKAEESKQTYRQVLNEFPDGYYAYLSEKRSGIVAKLPTVEHIDGSETALPEDLQHGLDRSRHLTRAGLDEFALAEVRQAIGRADAAARRAVLPQLPGVQAFTQALRTSLTLYAQRKLEENELYPYLYPIAFEQVVADESRTRGLDPYLVYSLMRQESLFDHRAASPAAAYGLMQLLLSTARRIAPKAGVASVELDDLFEPEINIKLGTAYLAELAERFDNDLVLMLAGYNAGETAAERWRDRLQGVELDEFVERISYRETRGYVKKILRNYRNYLRLYGEVGAGAAVESVD